MSREEIQKGIEGIISDKGYYFPVDETTQDMTEGVVIPHSDLTDTEKRLVDWAEGWEK